MGDGVLLSCGDNVVLHTRDGIVLRAGIDSVICEGEGFLLRSGDQFCYFPLLDLMGAT